MNFRGELCLAEPVAADHWGDTAGVDVAVAAAVGPARAASGGGGGDHGGGMAAPPSAAGDYPCLLNVEEASFAGGAVT